MLFNELIPNIRMVLQQLLEMIDEFEDALEHHEQYVSIHLLIQVYLHQSNLHVIGRQVNHAQYYLDLKGVFQTNNHNDNNMYLILILSFFFLLLFIISYSMNLSCMLLIYLLFKLCNHFGYFGIRFATNSCMPHMIIPTKWKNWNTSQNT